MMCFLVLSCICCLLLACTALAGMRPAQIECAPWEDLIKCILPVSGISLSSEALTHAADYVEHQQVTELDCRLRRAARNGLLALQNSAKRACTVGRQKEGSGCARAVNDVEARLHGPRSGAEQSDGGPPVRVGLRVAHLEAWQV